MKLPVLFVSAVMQEDSQIWKSSYLSITFYVSANERIREHMEIH